MTAVETDLFLVSDVQWKYTELQENTGSIDQSAMVKEAIRKADIQCRRCSARWKAGEGSSPGQLRRIMGSVEITCPECGAYESVAARLLD